MDKEKRKRKTQKAPKQAKPKPTKESKSKFDIARMMEEREAFYRGLKEIEELKQTFSQMIAEDEAEERENALIEQTRKKEVSSTLRVIGDKPPGREVLFAANHCQCFHKSKIEKIKLENGLTYSTLRSLLYNRMEISHVITNEAMFSLFLLMSLDEDEGVIDSCYRLLKKNIFTFAPKFRHIINVFLNWGATCESLNINVGEKAEVFRNGIRTKQSDPSYTFNVLSYTKVLDYVGEVCLLNPQNYSKTEKAILLKCLFRMSLDKTFSIIPTTISGCISRVIESFPQWDSFMVANLTRLIHDDKDHFHNQVAIIMNTMPQINRCNDLLSCIYYYVLRMLVQLPPKYEFPYEDDAIPEILKAMQFDPNNDDDLYRLYVTVQLVNYIVYHRNLYKNEKVLSEISQKMDELRWAVARSTKNFDAALVKGRILYCSTMWSMSVPKQEES